MTDPRRRGVALMLTMMVMVLLSSLAAVMAITARANVRTAASHMQVNRAMGAAETGLVFATTRLRNESSRFVVKKGVIDDNFGAVLWYGPVTPDPGDADGVEVLPTTEYLDSLPDSLGEALFNAHKRSINAHAITIDPGDADLPVLDQNGSILWAPPIALTAVPDGTPEGAPNPDGPYFRLKYEFVSIPGEAAYVRVTSRGFDRKIKRTLTMDYKLDKKIKYSVVARSRIMIGKNVRVEGPLGTRFGIVPEELQTPHGDPIHIVGDFNYLDPALDTTLGLFYDQVVAHDVDNDGRLRPLHPIEGAGVTALGGVVSDYDQDGYVSDFDAFLEKYDSNGGRDVVYDSALAGGAAVEFNADLRLCHLIDSGRPDRNGDGIAGDALDTLYGYLDGRVDAADQYFKAQQLLFAIDENSWNVANGENYRNLLHGPIVAPPDESPVRFEVPEEELRDLDASMFSDTATWFAGQVGDGSEFTSQANSQNGSPSFWGDGTTAQIVVPVNAMDSRPGTNWQSIPFGAPGAYDFFNRVIYRNMHFKNVRIPKGTNAEFQHCLFEGVAYVDMQVNNDDENWNYVQALERVNNPAYPGTPGAPQYLYEEKYPGLPCELNGNPITNTKAESNSILLRNCYVVGSVASPTTVQYTQWRNKFECEGYTRFFIYDNDPGLDMIDPNEASVVRAMINDLRNDGVLEQLETCQIMMPNVSVEIANFGPLGTPPTRLFGTLVVGLLDMRGYIECYGTVMNTLLTVPDAGPLAYGGQPDAFNATYGMFGPNEGDGEGVNLDDVAIDGWGEILLKYNPDAKLPDGIPWPIQCGADALTYWEGGDL